MYKAVDFLEFLAWQSILKSSLQTLWSHSSKCSRTAVRGALADDFLPVRAETPMCSDWPI